MITLELNFHVPGRFGGVVRMHACLGQGTLWPHSPMSTSGLSYHLNLMRFKGTLITGISYGL